MLTTIKFEEMAFQRSLLLRSLFSCSATAYRHAWWILGHTVVSANYDTDYSCYAAPCTRCQDTIPSLPIDTCLDLYTVVIGFVPPKKMFKDASEWLVFVAMPLRWMTVKNRSENNECYCYVRTTQALLELYVHLIRYLMDGLVNLLQGNINTQTGTSTIMRLLVFHQYIRDQRRESAMFGRTYGFSFEISVSVQILADDISVCAAAKVVTRKHDHFFSRDSACLIHFDDLEWTLIRREGREK